MGESSGKSWVGNKRINSQDKEDRISCLPDSVIQYILSFLPSTREAIRTSILSKRWRNQWTHLLVLIFKPWHGIDGRYFRFIENTLNLHDSPKIKKFQLEYDSESKEDLQFISKIRFATRKSVEELILLCYNVSAPILLPEFLFDTASLVRLEMLNCYFKPSWRVNWPSLKSLKMDCTRLTNNNCSNGIENVVSGSPLLEWLELNGRMVDRLTIVSRSLKVLLLSFFGSEIPKAWIVSCPNLVELNVVPEKDYLLLPDQMLENILSGTPFIQSLKLDSIYGPGKLVVASESLKVLHIDVEIDIIEVSCPNLEELYFCGCGDGIFKTVNLPSSICATLEFYFICGRDNKSLVKELLEQFQHVNELTVGRLFFKEISNLDVEFRLSLPSINSKCLTLNVGYDFGLTLPGMAYALCSPTLETLVVNFNFMNYEFKYYIRDILDKDLHIDYWNSNVSSGHLTCLVSHLKTVKIIGLYGKDGIRKLVVEFIEHILKNSRVLETMLVSFDKRSGTDFVNEISRTLLSFPRYSQRANIELLCS